MTLPRTVLVGTALALAVALPAAFLAQILQAVGGDDHLGATTGYPLASLVLGGMVLGGWVTGARASRPPLVHGALVGLVAITLVLAIGLSRRAVAGEPLMWSTVLLTTLVACALGATGAVLGHRQAGRTRPRRAQP